MWFDSQPIIKPSGQEIICLSEFGENIKIRNTLENGFDAFEISTITGQHNVSADHVHYCIISDYECWKFISLGTAVFIKDILQYYI